MKKHMALLLCALMVLASCATLPAMAAEQHHPVSVEEYTYGPLDELRIDKIYQLSLSDDPSGIPTGDFDRNGRHYYLLDMVRKDEVGVDTQPHTETVTMDSDTGDLAEVLKRLDAQMEVATEDGHTGTLVLDHTSVKVEVKGYKTSSRSLSATRTYPSLSDADLALIPTTITDGGKTLTLADVQWASDGTYYTATAKYTGSSSSRHATGYTVTASYTGEVAKTNCEVVTYTAIFGSTKMEEPEPTSVPEPAPEVETPASLGLGTNYLPVLGIVGGVIALLVAACWGWQKIKERKLPT